MDKTEQARQRYAQLLLELRSAFGALMDEYDKPYQSRDKTLIAQLDARIDQIRDQLDVLVKDLL